MAIRDIPDLQVELPKAIYSNLNDQISADTPSPLPAGKKYHAQMWRDMIESSINRITDDPLLNLRTWNAPRIYKPEETCVGVVGKQIYLNVSGINLVNIDPEIPGNSGTSGEDWYPLTGGAALTFDIPLWNDSGIVQDLATGVIVNNGTFIYPHLQIVRAENGLYQRNDVTLPAPVSTNFLTEYNAGLWIFLGVWTSMTNAIFRNRATNGQLTANRTYLINDARTVDITGAVTNTASILLKATSSTNYSRDGWLIANYTGAAPLRGTIEMEAVKYDVVNNRILERTDNYGNFTRQTSTAVNGGGAANAVDLAPWGHTAFTNNNLNNARFAAAWAAYANITSFTNFDVTNELINNAVPAAPIVMNNNRGNTGTLEWAAATTLFSDNVACDGATVITTGNLSNCEAYGSGNTNSAPNSRVSGINGTIGAGASRAFLHSGGAASIAASATDAVVFGVSSSATAPKAIVIADGGTSTARHGVVLGNHGTASKESAFVIGKYGIGNINNSITWGFENAADMPNAIGQLQGMIIPLGITVTDATITPLITLRNPFTAGSSVLVIPTGHVWSVEFDIIACTDVTNISRWLGNFVMINTAGVITYPGLIAYQDTAGAWATHASTPAVRSQVGAAMGGIVFTSTGATPLVNFTGIAATNINVFGRLLVNQLGQG